MNWIGMAVGAAAGVVAVLISAGILKLLGKSNSKGTSVLHVIVFAAALALGRELVEPRLQAQQVEYQLLELQVYRALKQYEPDSYAQIVAAFKEGIASKRPMEQIWATTRPVVGDVTSKRLPHASDAVLMSCAGHIVTAVSALHASGGTSCFSYINPAPGEATNFTAILGKEFEKKELDLLAEVVTSAAGTTREPVPERDATADIEAVVGKLMQKYTQEDLASLQNPSSPTLDKRKFCQMTADLYREAMSLPEPRNAQLVRYLMQPQ
jgi:hypothetical protein